MVVVAQPGAGKTTRVPPALVDDGPVVLLQPRRVAARAIARRIADERGWTVGREVGWQIRLERRFSEATQLLVVTEGVLTARLQRDPLLSGFRTVIVDEFHERSVHADLALALAKQAWLARDDLRIAVMSATLDAAPVAAFLGGCEIVEVPGRTFPLDVSYAPGQPIAAAVVDLVADAPGDVLCFLPGAAEIRRAAAEIAPRVKPVEVVPLYGAMEAAEQDRALRRSSSRRVIVATNVAETSVTVPGVTAVVDSGLHKVARYDADRGIDSLSLERITADAAAQRAGRAGREAPGVVRRLWDERDRLRPHREPEIARIDLAATALAVMAWGGDPRTFEWFDPPREDRLGAAMALLERLGAAEGGRLTPLGDSMRRFALHPRLARMLIAAGGAERMARACALLSERHFLPPRTATTSSDLLSALDDWSAAPPHVQAAAREIARNAAEGHGGAPDSPPPLDDDAFRRVLLAGYPDRVAQRREPRSPYVRLASGGGAVIARESGVRDGEFLLALDVSGKWGREYFTDRVNPAGAGESVIRIASRIDREWLTPTSSALVHRFDEASGAVRAARIERYDALVLSDTPVAPEPAEAARLLAQAWRARALDDEDAQLVRRLRFAGRVADLDAIAERAAAGALSIRDMSVARGLAGDVLHALDCEAPDSIRLPSGRTARLDYADDGSASAWVKLQELFGLADTPRIGTRGAPIVFHLLAPNGRPVQTTRDLRSFWNKTYPEVRKELRGRYPKHPWPEDPWTAAATHRTVRRK